MVTSAAPPPSRRQSTTPSHSPGPRSPGSAQTNRAIRSSPTCNRSTTLTADAPSAANLAQARRYLAALESGAVGPTLAAFFTPDVVQREFPNRLVPAGAVRDLAALLDGAVRGQSVLSAQRFEIKHAVASGDEVALEVLWSGRLAVPIGALAAGDVMRAHFGVFLTFRDGRIASQRNYDCFEAF